MTAGSGVRVGPGPDGAAEAERVAALAGRLREVLPGVPEIAVVLGSGLGSLAERLRDPITFPGRDLPHYPLPAVAGHGPNLLFGRLGGRTCLVLAGRVHLYEGCEPETVARAVRAVAELGPRALVLTNAAGSLRPALPPGRLMLAADFVHLMGNRLAPLALVRPGTRAPKRGKPLSRREEMDETAVALERTTEPAERAERDLQAGAERAAGALGIPLARGVLAAVLGPCYETAAEIALLRRLGADAVTMSTVPELLAARRRRLPVLVLTVLTNWATGVGPRLAHEDVTVRAAAAARDLGRLLEEIAAREPGGGAGLSGARAAGG